MTSVRRVYHRGLCKCGKSDWKKEQAGAARARMLLLRSPAARRNAAVAVGCAGAACIATITQQQPPSHSAAAASLRGMFLGGGASANTKGNIHLRYFDARGAAETSRLLMALVGQPFTEDRWAIDFTRLSGDQMSPGMAAARQEGKLVANLDRAPVLVVDGGEIGQSKAIERFLARRLGLMGKDEIEAGRIDCFSEHIRAQPPPLWCRPLWPFLRRAVAHLVPLPPRCCFQSQLAPCTSPCSRGR